MKILNRDQLINVMGWYGTCAILIAYALSSFGWMEQGTGYQVLNASGAFCVALVCFRKKTWQAFWLEAVWCGVAVIALVSAYV